MKLRWRWSEQGGHVHVRAFVVPQVEAAKEPCSGCGGSGTMLVSSATGYEQDDAPCDDCNGKGHQPVRHVDGAPALVGQLVFRVEEWRELELLHRTAWVAPGASFYEPLSIEFVREEPRS